MEVKILTKGELFTLQEYNNRVFPDKVIPADKYLGFWFGRNDKALEQCLILQADDGTIHGQILASEMSYYYNHNRIDTVWIFDLIVDEHLRKDGWGVDVLLACMNRHPCSCSTGSGPTALPIHLKMGNKKLGEIRKYIGIINPLGIFTSIFRNNVIWDRYPLSITTKGKCFHKLSIDDIPELCCPYNENLFEIARDQEFIKWRFFNELHQYAFYKDDQSNDFFVVRTTIQKHVTVMVLVDYRCNMQNSESFESIFYAVKKIMLKLRLSVLIVGSSLKVVDDVLEHHRFKSIGRPRPVIGFVKKNRAEDVDGRTFLFTTFADSDGETNWA